jgi:hypothetical protein
MNRQYRSPHARLRAGTLPFAEEKRPACAPEEASSVLNVEDVGAPGLIPFPRTDIFSLAIAPFARTSGTNNPQAAFVAELTG